MEENKIVGRLLMSITDNEVGTTTLDRTYGEYCENFGNIYWLVEEFKYFLKAMSFPQELTDRIVLLDEGEKVINEFGKVVMECK